MSSPYNSILLAATLVALAGAPLLAQNGALVGTVVDQGTFQPLRGATVSVEGARISTRTDRDGNFSLPRLPAGTVRMRVAAQGFSEMIENVEITADEVSYAQFQLLSVAVVLDAVRAVGRSSGSQPADLRATETENMLSAADLLARRVPGVSVTAGGTGGQTSGRILIRGVRSLNLSSEPVIFLNGVRITSPAGASRNQAFQILDGIPATEVSRIRVLRGASAGSIYSDSANGVILVETRTPQAQ